MIKISPSGHETSGHLTKLRYQMHSRQYEFKVMPFSLLNVPATIQSLMNDIFSPI